MNPGDQEILEKNRDFLIKQSEMLQSIIERMARNSLEVKKLGFTLWTALVGFGFTNKIPSLFFLALVALIFMGFLDMYYLMLERRFRTSFNKLSELLCGFSNNSIEHIKQVRGNFVKPGTLSTEKIFSMYLGTLKSWANLPYLIVILITLILLSVPVQNN